jgi:hypothetical protein
MSAWAESDMKGVPDFFYNNGAYFAQFWKQINKKRALQKRPFLS